MSYIRRSVSKLLSSNSYPGRGIIVGKSSDGKSAVLAYFIMGRSLNSRNRVFSVYGDEVRTEPFDASKVVDPSLIIYSAIKSVNGDVIVTNGDQTDTVEQFVKDGKCFRAALKTRRFEPDCPNFTPRISAMLHFGATAADGKFGYEMSILKSADSKGKNCNRYFFDYEPVNGVGHFLHTYDGDGNPLPTFSGEPERVKVPNEITEFANEIWDSLDDDNKISLYCRYINIKTGEAQQVLFNKNLT